MFRFKRMTEDDSDNIYFWRRSEHVTKFMYTDLDEDKEKHQKWFNTKLNSINNQYFIIYHNEEKIGLISLNNIDFVNNRASSGFYIGDFKFAPLAGRIFPYFLNYVFYEMNLNKLVIEVMSNNIGMKKIDMYYGFRVVGVLKEHIFKNGVYHDVDILELTKAEWNMKRKFHKLTAEFR